MGKLEKLKKRIKTIELASKKECVVIVDTTHPEGVEIIGEYNSLDEAKEVAKTVSKERRLPNLAWFVYLNDEPLRPPFFVYISKISPGDVEVIDV